MTAWVSKSISNEHWIFAMLLPSTKISVSPRPIVARVLHEFDRTWKPTSRASVPSSNVERRWALQALLMTSSARPGSGLSENKARGRGGCLAIAGRCDRQMLAGRRDNNRRLRKADLQGPSRLYEIKVLFIPPLQSKAFQFG